MRRIAMMVAAALVLAMPMEAQLLQAIKKAADKPAEQKTQTQPAKQEQSKAQTVVQNNGKIYYVSANGKSRGADGLSPETAKKDIQAVLNIIKENGENGAIVRVGEGNFLGYNNQ